LWIRNPASTAGGWRAPGALVVEEAAKAAVAAPGALELDDQQVYGNTRTAFFAR